MTANALNLIGLALKAGRLEIGEEPVSAACRAHGAKVVLLASDAAENSVHRAEKFAQAGNVSCVITPFSKAELGHSIGRASCAMLAMTDAGLAASLMSKLAVLDPERYGEVAGMLNDKADAARKLQKAKRDQERNKERSKRKPWAAPAPQKKSGSSKKQ